MVDIDSLISAAWVLPIEPAEAVLPGHSVAITDGRIVEVLDTATALQRYRPRRHFERPGHALLPGFVNAHTHAAMTLFRGLADDLPLMDWLRRHIWPAEKRHMSKEFVRDGTRLAALEMLRSGTTCFSDMYFFPDVAGAAAAEVGMRAVVGLIVLDAPTLWASDLNEYFAQGTRVHDEFRGHDLITTAFAPHAPYTVSDAALSRLGTLAEELDVPIHMHVHETGSEVSEAVAATGVRPLARLERLGLLSPRLVAVHMTALLPEERETVARCGVHVVHCPQSNLKLASGFCPVAELIEQESNVALGTDGAASNNDLDMLCEMRTAALLTKGIAGRADALPAHQVLYMATLAGANALGQGERIGSLKPGKQADLIAIDLGLPETQPVYHPASQIVYAAAREAVTDVWVRGVQVLAARSPTLVSSEEALERARWWQHRIATEPA